MKGIVDREVGFVPPSRAGLGEESRAGETASLGGKTAFFYVEDKRIVGFCMVEVISKAYVLLNAPQEEDDDGSNGSIHAPAPTLNEPSIIEEQTLHQFLPVKKGVKYIVKATFHLRSYDRDNCDYDRYSEWW